ncbi:hypothetical protein DEU31_3034 [Brachybacterium sp. AG952]|uniref:hypothetical protein n=1 Tax=Brachybacterium sp. AG952 TaxID=2183989 RepID=UPI00105F99C7|nr:hypothetical protein [Brachybacterium sp. AG952]TDP76327.1 hypothetical protein DEU31_3034 [Brachybacterium sp. AG952]
MSNVRDEIKVGDRIRFAPQRGNRWWRVDARDERFIIASQRLTGYHPEGTQQYTVVDLTGWTFTYNGVGPGKVRSSINLLGGGYDMDEPGWADRMLAELQSGELELSHRRVMSVWEIEVETR